MQNSLQLVSIPILNSLKIGHGMQTENIGIVVEEVTRKLDV
jgi:hypothetical protein